MKKELSSLIARARSALEHLLAGPLVGGAERGTTLPSRYRECQAVLIEMLATLLAEGRGAGNPGFSKLKREIRRRSREGTVTESSSALWRRFLAVRYETGALEGSPRWPIGDQWFAEALEALAYDPRDSLEIDHAGCDIRLLGLVYEELTELEPLVEEGRVSLATSKARRKAAGTYYTPQPIIDLILSETLGRLVRRVSARGRTARDPSRLLDSYLELKILDPALGSGLFLLGAADFLACAMAEDGNLAGRTEHTEDDYRRLVATRCLYGVDVDPLAVAIARASLSLHTGIAVPEAHLRVGDSLIGARLDEVLSSAPCRMETLRLRSRKERARQRVRAETGLPKIRGLAEHARERPDRLRAVANLWIAPYLGVRVGKEDYVRVLERLAAGDGLPDQEPWFQEAQSAAEGRRCFHWELEFPEVLLEPQPRRRGFSAVIGNPPYVSFGLRRAGKLADGERAFFLDRFPEAAEYKISSYALFIARALRLLRRDGYQSFVVPDSFLQGKYYSLLRGQILSNALQSVFLFREDFWRRATVGQPVVYCLRRARSGRPQSVQIAVADKLADLGTGAVRRDRVDQCFFEAQPLRRVRLIIGAERRRLVAELEARGEPLASFVKFYSGLIGRKGQRSVTIHGRPEDWSPTRYAPLIASSACLDRFRISHDGDYCPKAPKAYKSGYTPEIYEGVKLFLNQTGDHLKCCYDDAGYYCLNNMHVGYPVSADCDLLYVNAILCSKLMDFYYRAIAMEERRPNAQVDIDMIDALPVPRPRRLTPARPRARLLAQGERLAAGGDQPAFGAWAREVCAQAPGVVQELVAHLAGRMTELKKQRLSAGASAQASLARREAGRPRGPEPGPGPLDEALLATDRAIDVAVYALYGLTKKETGIIEGRWACDAPEKD